jgi:large subunit ribosomal protein L3
MAARMPSRWAAALMASANNMTTTTTTTRSSCLTSLPRILITPRGHPLLPRTAKRGVKYGWSTAPKRGKPGRFNQVSSGLPAPTTGPAAALARKEATTPLRTGVLAIKKGVSAMYDTSAQGGGRRTPCTVLQLDRVEVVAQRTRAAHGYWAVQLGLGEKQAANVTAPQLGYYEAKGLAPKRHLAEFRVRGEAGLLPVGVQLQPDWFKLGQFVDARSNSRGMGFAGGMKRHGFAGQEASHGNSKNHRTIGSNGPSQGGGSRVHPGKKMPGRMGGQRVTVQNLRVLKVDNEMGIVVIKGHIAGPKGCLVMLSDSIKKEPPVQSFIDKARQTTLDRNPDAASNLEAARTRHLELKAMRKDGSLQELIAAGAAI